MNSDELKTLIAEARELVCEAPDSCPAFLGMGDYIVHADNFYTFARNNFLAMVDELERLQVFSDAQIRAGMRQQDALQVMRSGLEYYQRIERGEYSRQVTDHPRASEALVKAAILNEKGEV